MSQPPPINPEVRTAMGAGAWAALVIAIVIVASLGWGVYRTSRRAPLSPISPMSSRDAASTRAQQQTQLASAARSIEHRSPFAPPRPPEPPKPAVPPRYAGSSVVGVAANSVYFADGRRIPVGKAEGDVEVISINAPWSVKVRWSGGEYDVTLVDREPIRFDQADWTKDTLFKAAPAAPGTVTPEPEPESLRERRRFNPA